MPQPSRFTSPDGPTPRVSTGAFFGVVKEERDGSARHFVVHASSPRFVVEFDAPGNKEEGGRRAVIRRVCLPNSWAGDYHRSARLLSAAVAYFETPADGEKRSDPTT